MAHRPIAPLLAAVLAASSLASAQTAGDCGIAAQNVFVRDTMSDIYFWYQEMPEVDPAAYSSPDALLEALRYRPLDTYFSYVGMRAAEDAYYSESQFIGFGFSMKLVGPDDLRVSQVFPDSPAAGAGLARGSQLLQVNGVDVAALLATGRLDAAFGAGDVGVIARVRHRDLDGVVHDAEMAKALVTIPTVSLTRVYEVRGRKVGYVVFKNFVQPSVAALDAAFATLSAEGVSDLVLDLRYNGGGLVSVAQHLAGLVGGRATSGQTFAQFVHNDKNAHRNQTLRFPSPGNALALRRLLVVTTRNSASASELVINALRAFIPVIVIGETTYGKPVGQYGFNFCDRVLYPVAFTLRNAHGDGDFFDGLGPDCPAADDLQHAFGDPAEASLAEALQYSGSGTCTAGAAATARAQSLRRPPQDRQPHRGGWPQRVVAY
jgi:carboxyl-terminal processing protease